MGNFRDNYPNITFSESKQIHLEKVLSLYNDAGWTSYTNVPETLIKGISSSLFVYSAWDQDNLIGLIRVIGDDHTIIYIQDILVHSTYRRSGLGTALLQHICKRYSHIRQMVLQTDTKDETTSFYEKNGFSNINTLSLSSFLRTSPY